MGSFIGGMRFKVEEVNNGWIIEFHPRKTALHSRPTEKHVSTYERESLLEVIHNLLLEQHQLDQAEEPTASQTES